MDGPVCYPWYEIRAIAMFQDIYPEVVNAEIWVDPSTNRLYGLVRIRGREAAVIRCRRRRGGGYPTLQPRHFDSADPELLLWFADNRHRLILVWSRLSEIARER